MTLTTIGLLAAHLTDENHEALLGAARHKSRREVEQLVSSLVPQPDIASSLRRLPNRHVSTDAPAPPLQAALSTAPTTRVCAEAEDEFVDRGCGDVAPCACGGQKSGVEA